MCENAWTQRLARARAEHDGIADDLTRLIDTANAPIIGIDSGGLVNEWNQTATRITGFTKEEAFGQNLVDTFITEDYKKSVREVLENALRGQGTSDYEFPLFTKAGKRIHLLLNATTWRNKDRTIIGVIGIGQDISGRYEKEEQLRQRARLEAVGSLTGGIAHDFNNLLTVVIGNLSMLSPRGQEEIEIIDDAMKAARNGSELVRNLLAFSRRQSLKPKPSNMDSILNDFQRSLGRALGESISLEVHTPELGLAAFIDRPQFEAALINLCINARDAITSNGTIQLVTFSASPNSSDRPLDWASKNPEAGFVCVQITDNGSGISPELLTKITEPYFTTKEVGEGSGLGLSSVVGFMEQSGGNMRIFSTPGIGTTVELFLPRSSSALVSSEEETTVPSANFSQERSKTTILVVDDEPDILRLATRWLKKSGYEVLTADSGEKALSTIIERNGEINILFSDIVMPGLLNGWELAEEVSARYPKIGIQLATGFDAERKNLTTGSEKTRFPVLFKPYSLTDLSDSIQVLTNERLRLSPTSKLDTRSAGSHGRIPNSGHVPTLQS